MRSESDKLLCLFRDGAPDDWTDFSNEEKSFPQGNDSTGVPWIIEIVSCGSPECVRWAIEHEVELKFRAKTGDTVLHACIERKKSASKYEILSILITAGADIDLTGYNGWAPLHLAAVRNDMRSAEILLDAGADKFLRTTIDDCATAEEEAISAGNKDLARYIREFE
ncbi:ankyrin repeat domain-containing protein [Hyphococcus flavus]|uniref:Ankyrin repeat domain-containing protein n=1 Tax=Hyphococcus flavus TaxID=1866326 RepID=A0AAE9ZD82_9PROT|nr:ankyrin repeat domain-containing protein [Hyphococcus flavus]WDI30817.1 ankyrin repeat domain-containing protein [Hyphococcus flavus]